MDTSTGPKPRKHVFGYMDETGILHGNVADRVFGLGLLVSHNPRELHRSIIQLKNKRKYHNEFKFTDITTQNLRIYIDLIDVFFSCTNNRFHSLIIDKVSSKPISVAGHSTALYNKHAAKLIASSIDSANTKTSEYMTILADDVSTSKDDKFEKVIRERVRRKHRRNALFGIARLESHAVTEIQVTDVLLGLVAYSFKIKLGVISGKGAKLRLLKHLQKKLSVSSLSQAQLIKLRRGELFEIIVE